MGRLQAQAGQGIGCHRAAGGLAFAALLKPPAAGGAMAIQLNHTIVHARDAAASARFLAELLGLDAPVPFGPFQAVQLSNGVTLDYLSTDEPFLVEHYAFLVSEAEFDQVFGRLQARGLPYWADPGHHRLNQINHGDGGRGLYWSDPDGHNLEIITKPYGSGGG
jgi:catechol 2,3-dioxygenase-like lactoylglutathione lyase family enzyme